MVDKIIESLEVLILLDMPKQGSVPTCLKIVEEFWHQRFSPQPVKNSWPIPIKRKPNTPKYIWRKRLAI